MAVAWYRPQKWLFAGGLRCKLRSYDQGRYDYEYTVSRPGTVVLGWSPRLRDNTRNKVLRSTRRARVPSRCLYAFVALQRHLRVTMVPILLWLVSQKTYLSS